MGDAATGSEGKAKAEKDALTEVLLLIQVQG